MVSEQTRKEDERLREELRHVDLEKLKTVIKPLLQTKIKTPKKSASQSKHRWTTFLHALRFHVLGETGQASRVQA